MKTLSLFALLFSLPAFASHPHDRVCVGNAAIAGQDSVSFTFQWEIGRMYDHGGPNEDSHEFTFEAMSCYGDYNDLIETCRKSKDPQEVLPGGSRAKAVPAVLKDERGNVFFTGTFDFTKETLKGKIDRGPGAPDQQRGQLADVTVKLQCVSQPRLKLEVSAE